MLRAFAIRSAMCAGAVRWPDSIIEYQLGRIPALTATSCWVSSRAILASLSFDNLESPSSHPVINITLTFCEKSRVFRPKPGRVDRTSVCYSSITMCDIVKGVPG